MVGLNAYAQMGDCGEKPFVEIVIEASLVP